MTKNVDMLSCLTGMAEITASRWEDETDNPAQEAQYALVYAQICSAIAALNEPKPFLQIGMHFLHRDSIIRMTTYSMNIEIATKEMTTGGYTEYPAEFKVFRYRTDSPEGKALLEWLQGQSEVLVAYEEKRGGDEEDKELPYVPGSLFDDIVCDEPNLHPCVCGDPHCSGCF